MFKGLSVAKNYVRREGVPLTIFLNLLEELLHLIFLGTNGLSTITNSFVCFLSVGTRYCGDIGFLLDLRRDIDRLRIEIEVTSLNDIFFQHHNAVVAIA